jgi:SAM-dependent methyltransferase
VTHAANADQSEYWNAARHWIDDAAGHDAMLEPLGRLAQAALGVQPGDRVLDIGCGTGTTTLALAAAAEPGGAAIGVDISALLLGVARERAAGRPNVSFVEGDAQTHPFDPDSFDRAFSRFGVMFFGDPVAAFANIHGALRPGGGIAFVCWQSAADNEWMSVAISAVRGWVDIPSTPDTAPGPFALSDRGRLDRILTGAGFDEITVEDVRAPVLLGGPGDVDTALAFLAESRIGRQIREHASDPDAAFAAIRDALGSYVTPEGVRMTAAVWLVTGRA